LDNLGHQSYEDLVAYGPIDVVYTWVNGSDPRWLAKKNFWATSMLKSTILDVNISGVNTSHLDDSASDNRYRERDELRYSLRSLEKYAPWIRKVFIVTDNQLPHWLDLNYDRVEIVDHKNLFDNSSHLPVFSSPAIETHIHKIKGLSKHFIYFNDDVFLGAPTRPEDFLSIAGIQKFIFAWDVPRCASGCVESWIGDGYCDSACNNSACSWDDGDCSSSNIHGSSNTISLTCAKGCPDKWLGDSACDARCNTRECGFDAGDCGGIPRISSEFPGVSVGIRKNNGLHDDPVTMNTRLSATGQGKMYQEVVVLARKEGSIDTLESSQLEKIGLLNTSPYSNASFSVDYGVHAMYFNLSGALQHTSIDEQYDRSYDRYEKGPLIYHTMSSMIRTAIYFQNHAILLVLFHMDEDHKIDVLEEWDGPEESIFFVRGASKSVASSESYNFTVSFTLVFGEPKIEENDNDDLAGSLLGNSEYFSHVDGTSSAVNVSKFIPLQEKVTRISVLVDSSNSSHNHRNFRERGAGHVTTSNPVLRAKMAALALSSFIQTTNFEQPCALFGTSDSKLLWDFKAIQTVTWESTNGTMVQKIWRAPLLNFLVADTSIAMLKNYTSFWEWDGEKILTNIGNLTSNDLHKIYEQDGRGALLVFFPADLLCEVNGWVSFKFEVFAPKSKKEAMGRVHLTSATIDFKSGAVLASLGKFCSFQASNVTTQNDTMEPSRKLADTYKDSLILVNRLYSKAFGFANRKVPAHVPHLINRDIVDEMQREWPIEWDITSSNKFRSSYDMQYAFAYYHFVINRPYLVVAGNVSGLSHSAGAYRREDVSHLRGNLSPESRVNHLVLDFIRAEIDSDRNGFLDENEFRSLAAFTNPTSSVSTDEFIVYLKEKCVKPYISESPGGSWRIQISTTTLWQCHNVTEAIKNYIIKKTQTHVVDTSDDYAFEMIGENETQALSQLDSIRHRRSKFICVNDDVKNSSRAHELILRTFFESYLPIPSRFELPPGTSNHVLYPDQLKTHTFVLWDIVSGTVAMQFLLLIQEYTLTMFYDKGPGRRDVDHQEDSYLDDDDFTISYVALSTLTAIAAVSTIIYGWKRIRICPF
jgi:hypothetical protein